MHLQHASTACYEAIYSHGPMKRKKYVNTFVFLLEISCLKRRSQQEELEFLLLVFSMNFELCQMVN